MGNKQRKAIKRQRKKADESKWLNIQQDLKLRLAKYSKLTPTTLEELRSERLTTILSVLESHQRRRTLPPLLRNEFPLIHQFKIMSPPGKFTADFQTELRWVTARALINGRRLRSLLLLRRQFSVHFLLNETSAANEVIRQMESKFGASNWLLEAKLLTAEQSGGFEANRKTLSDVLNSTFPHNVKLLAEFSSQRVDPTMSPTHYLKCINQFIADGNYEAIHPCLPFYLRFTLATQIEQMGQIEEASAAYLLHQDCARPLIDQYCTLVKLLRHLLCSGQHSLLLDNESVSRFVKDLEPELLSISACIGSSSAFPMTSSIRDANELFSRGEFRAVLTIAKLQIVTDPLEFQWYELIARATLQTETELPTCFPAESPAQCLLEAVFRFLHFDGETLQSFTELLRVSRSFDGLPIGYQIAGFCQRAVPHKVVDANFGPIAYSSQFPPQNVCLLPLGAKRNICAFLGINEATLATRLIDALSTLSQRASIPPNDLGMDAFRWAIVIGDSLNALLRHVEAVSTYMQVIANPNSKAPELADATRGIASALLALRKFDDIAELIATTRLEHLTLLLLVEVGRIVGHYTDSAHETPAANLGWAVLFMLDYVFGNTRREDLFEVYANFMESTGELRPSQIGLQPPSSCSKSAYCFFLRWVCQPQVMDSDVEFSGQTDVEAERVAICQLLQVLDPDQKDAYAAEISELQQSLAVRRAMKHVAESKIHYNVEGIEKALGVSFAEQFQRYRALANLGDFARKSIDLQWATPDGVRAMSHDAAFSAFRQLFIDVRSAFLFSNEHGLDSYLSVRVRHETMKGTLRSVFERFNLITTTNKGAYQDNASWNEYLVFSETQGTQRVYSVFSNFSQSVDEIIALVSNQWIRIKDLQKQTEGLFDFDYSTDDLVDIYHQMKDCEDDYEFLDEIFARLRDRLMERLVVIRGVIETKLHELFLQKLEELTKAMEMVQSPVPAPLAASITHCRTEIQKTVFEISNWFTMHDSPQLDSISLSTLVTAVVESIGKCSPSAPFECEVVYALGENLILKGDVFVPLWDGLFLVFRNVVRHAGSNCARTNLSVTIEDECLVLEIRNPLGDAQSEMDVKARLQEILSQPPEIVRREDGSGLRKLQKLLRDDLKVATNHLDFYVKDGEFVTQLKLGLDGVQSC